MSLAMATTCSVKDLESKRNRVGISVLDANYGLDDHLESCLTSKSHMSIVWAFTQAF